MGRQRYFWPGVTAAAVAVLAGTGHWQMVLDIGQWLTLICILAIFLGTAATVTAYAAWACNVAITTRQWSMLRSPPDGYLTFGLTTGATR